MRWVIPKLFLLLIIFTTLYSSCKKEKGDESKPHIPFCDSVTNLRDGIHFQLYPNPASDFFIVDYQLADTAYIYSSLYDNVGRERIMMIRGMNEEGYQHRTFLIDSSLENGLYVLRFEICNKSFATQLLISR